MKLLQTAAAALAAGLATPASALRRQPGMQVGPIEPAALASDPTVNGTNGWGTFDQLIDHADPSLGTFQQRYWYGTAYWKGPGSPVILVDPGEQSATGFNVTYTTPQRLAGLMAQEVGGAVVVLEHRYWGESAPFDKTLTEANLQY